MDSVEKKPKKTLRIKKLAANIRNKTRKYHQFLLYKMKNIKKDYNFKRVEVRQEN